MLTLAYVQPKYLTNWNFGVVNALRLSKKITKVSTIHPQASNVSSSSWDISLWTKISSTLMVAQEEKEGDH